jgi:pimeloyl-ACP methyl ester carboxylesterase
LGKYGGEVYGNSRGGFFITIGSLLKATEYSWIDRINFFRGIFASMRLIWPQLLNVDLMVQASELKVPVYFLEGKHDYEAPSLLAEQYYETLKAPGKKLIWFENSAHFLNAEEVDKFNEFLSSRFGTSSGYKLRFWNGFWPRQHLQFNKKEKYNEIFPINACTGCVDCSFT